MKRDPWNEPKGPREYITLRERPMRGYELEALLQERKRTLRAVKPPLLGRLLLSPGLAVVWLLKKVGAL